MNLLTLKKAMVKLEDWRMVTFGQLIVLLVVVKDWGKQNCK